MNRHLQQMWTEDDGVLSFEWVLLTTILVIGIVGGLAAARDGIIDELGDAAQAMLALDQSYSVDHPLQVGVNQTGNNDPILSLSSDSGFLDTAEYDDCARDGALDAQGPELDNPPAP